MSIRNLSWGAAALCLAIPCLLIGQSFTINEARAESAGGAAGQAVKRDIESLIGHCQSGDIAKAAGYVVYRGPDKARRWHDVAKASNEMERGQVEGICKRIKGLVDGSTGRNFHGYSTERESEGTFHIWKVQFQGSAPQEVIFAMLKVKGRYALADLD